MCGNVGGYCGAKGIGDGYGAPRHDNAPTLCRFDGIKVHMQSVMRDVRGDSYVYIVTPENKVEQRSVTVARTDGVYWVVDTGLKAGDRVMFEGFQRVQPGATVTAKEVDFSSLPEGKPLF